MRPGGSPWPGVARPMGASRLCGGRGLCPGELPSPPDWVPSRALRPGVGGRVVLHCSIVSALRDLPVSRGPFWAAQSRCPTFCRSRPCHLRIHCTTPGGSPCEPHGASVTHAFMSRVIESECWDASPLRACGYLCRRITPQDPGRWAGTRCLHNGQPRGRVALGDHDGSYQRASVTGQVQAISINMVPSRTTALEISCDGDQGSPQYAQGTAL